jgi:phosphopantetheine adenylyltransferase
MFDKVVIGIGINDKTSYFPVDKRVAWIRRVLKMSGTGWKSKPLRDLRLISARVRGALYSQGLRTAADFE